MTPRFVSDRPLSRLAKWLRILGSDARWLSEGDDAALVAVARTEGRVVLTRSVELFRRRSTTPDVEIVLIETDLIPGQVRQVAARFGLQTTAQPFSRCLTCNTPLEPIDRAAVEPLVPPYVFQNQQRFVRCPACDRVYWEGTHWDRMRRELLQIFAD